MTYTIKINDLEQMCSKCTDKILPDGSTFCVECAVGNSLKHHIDMQRAENESSDYLNLLQKTSVKHDIPSSKLHRIVQEARKFYVIGSRKESSLSALKRISEALDV